MVSDKQIQDVVNSFGKIRQIVERLDGQNARELRAITAQTFLPLQSINAQMKSKYAAGATPTKAEYDSLVDDVRNVQSMLAEVARLLRQ